MGREGDRRGDEEPRVRGRISVNPRGFGFLKFERDGEPATALVPARRLAPFLQRDEVSARVGEDDKGRLVAEQLELEHRTRRHLFGHLTRAEDGWVLRVDPEVSNRRWPVVSSEVEELEEDLPVVARIADDGVHVQRVVAPADTGLERVRTRYEIRREFPHRVNSALQRKQVRDPEGRRDLREQTTLTIDAAESRDLDDALSVLPAGNDGGIRVLVSISDVDGFVPEGGPLDEEARHRGTSVYLAGEVTPMLPRVLSEDRLTLRQGVDRAAVTAELRIDPEGTVTSCDLYRSWIRSDARLTYEQAAAFLDHGDPGDIPPAVQSALRWLRTVSARLSAQRVARGGLSLDREEAYIEIDEHTREPTAAHARSDTSAHKLIERLMVATNEAVAGWLADRGLPGIFRVHPAPEPGQVHRLAESARHFGFELGLGDRLTPRSLSALEAQFGGSPLAPAMEQVLAKLLGPARYTVLPGSHFGLGSRRYLHFTSPIRRYADLVVHRVVKRYLAGDRSMEPGDPALETIAQSLNEAQWRARKAEEERKRTLSARLLREHLGERYGANVVSVKPFGLIVQLEDTGLTGVVPAEALPGNWKLEGWSLVGDRGRYDIGDRLDVVVDEVDEASGRIDLKPAHEGSKGGSP